MLFSINISSLLEDVKIRLEYLAGKTGQTGAEYFRLVPCDADLDLLKKIALECADFISLSFSGSATLSKRGASLLISIPVNYSESEDARLRPLLMYALVCRIVFRWLKLAGHPGGEFWEKEYEVTLNATKDNRHHYGPLKSRPLPPF